LQYKNIPNAIVSEARDSGKNIYYKGNKEKWMPRKKRLIPIVIREYTTNWLLDKIVQSDPFSYTLLWLLKVLFIDIDW
jgi:hypothetical protein